MPDKEITVTVHILPESVAIDGRIGADADHAEAFSLCGRLFDTVRDFDNLPGARQIDQNFSKGN